MLSAGVHGLNEGAAAAGIARPDGAWGDSTDLRTRCPESTSGQRLTSAVSGLWGIICAADDLVEVTRVAPELLTVVPGIRPDGSAEPRPRPPSNPGYSVQQGAGILVIGRAVTSVTIPRVQRPIANRVGRAI